MELQVRLRGRRGRARQKLQQLLIVAKLDAVAALASGDTDRYCPWVCAWYHEKLIVALSGRGSLLFSSVEEIAALEEDEENYRAALLAPASSCTCYRSPYEDDAAAAAAGAHLRELETTPISQWAAKSPLLLMRGDVTVQAKRLFRLSRSLDKARLAELLSAPSEGNALLRRAFMEEFSLHGVAVDDALRLVAAHCGIPGEAQQIYRILESFAAVYVEQQQQQQQQRSPAPSQLVCNCGPPPRTASLLRSLLPRAVTAAKCPPTPESGLTLTQTLQVLHALLLVNTLRRCPKKKQVTKLDFERMLQSSFPSPSCALWLQHLWERIASKEFRSALSPLGEFYVKLIKQGRPPAPADCPPASVTLRPVAVAEQAVTVNMRHTATLRLTREGLAFTGFRKPPAARRRRLMDKFAPDLQRREQLDAAPAFVAFRDIRAADLQLNLRGTAECVRVTSRGVLRIDAAKPPKAAAHDHYTLPRRDPLCGCPDRMEFEFHGPADESLDEEDEEDSRATTTTFTSGESLDSGGGGGSSSVSTASFEVTAASRPWRRRPPPPAKKIVAQSPKKAPKDRAFCPCRLLDPGVFVELVTLRLGPQQQQQPAVLLTAGVADDAWQEFVLFLTGLIRGCPRATRFVEQLAAASELPEAARNFRNHIAPVPRDPSFHFLGFRPGLKQKFDSKVRVVKRFPVYVSNEARDLFLLGTPRELSQELWTGAIDPWHAGLLWQQSRDLVNSDCERALKVGALRLFARQKRDLLLFLLAEDIADNSPMDKFSCCSQCAASSRSTPPDGFFTDLLREYCSREGVVDGGPCVHCCVDCVAAALSHYDGQFGPAALLALPLTDTEAGVGLLRGLSLICAGRSSVTLPAAAVVHSKTVGVDLDDVVNIWHSSLFAISPLPTRAVARLVDLIVLFGRPALCHCATLLLRRCPLGEFARWTFEDLIRNLFFEANWSAYDLERFFASVAAACSSAAG